jgi:peroxiredoxin family protein
MAEEESKQQASEKPTKVAIIASQGTLDGAYPPLIIASTAVAMDMTVGVFFTFYGLNILTKNRYKNLQVSGVGNPGMPIAIPNIVTVLPGMTWMATRMMRGWLKRAGTATVPELVDACLEMGVRMIACQMTMDVMNLKKEDLITGIEIGGAATFLEFAADADITLFM